MELTGAHLHCGRGRLLLCVMVQQGLSMVGSHLQNSRGRLLWSLNYATDVQHEWVLPPTQQRLVAAVFNRATFVEHACVSP